MVSKVRVYGKAMNHTALGIVNAFKVLYPNTTLEDLKKAFPNELNPDCGTKEIFMTKQEIDKEIAAGHEWFVEGNAYFAKENEFIELEDGNKVAVVRMWTTPSFDNIKTQAALYGIEIAKFESSLKGERGNYRLEYINGFVPPAPSNKKKMPIWLWILIGLLTIGAIAAAYFLGNSGKKTEIIEKENTIIVHDTVYTEKIEELETEFNAAKFEKGETELNDEAKFILHDLATLLKKNPEVKLKVEGHSSAEGTPAFNQNLSENRAKATVDFLISQGVEESRLSYEGFGSSKLKNTENPMAEENRRTEFIVEK